MAEGLNRFLGDTPGRVIIKLIVVSIVVGFVMAVFGLHPADILFTIRNFVLDLWHSGFAALAASGIICCSVARSSSRSSSSCA